MVLLMDFIAVQLSRAASIGIQGVVNSNWFVFRDGISFAVLHLQLTSWRAPLHCRIT
jgi:hypothetical protein